VDSGDQSVRDVALTTTFYSSNGTVVALSLTDLGTAMTPGQAIPFAVYPWDNTATLSNEIANYTITVQSIPVTPTATPEQTTAPTTQPTISTSGSPNPTQTPTTMTSITTYVIVIIIVVAIAIIASLILLKRRGKSHQNEAPTSPQPAAQP
jgi:hypothetical protein